MKDDSAPTSDAAITNTRTLIVKLLKALDELDVVLICAAHNEARTIELRNDFGGWPTKFGDPGADPAERIDNLIVVGGTNIRTQIGPHSPYADWFSKQIIGRRNPSKISVSVLFL